MTRMVMGERQLRLHAPIWPARHQSSGRLSKACQSSTTLTDTQIGLFATRKYIEATRSVLDRYPDDLEAGFMYADALMIRGAWNYWRRDGSPLPGTREAAAALEHLMALDPNHPGAVHLYVHLFESLLSRNELCRRLIGSNRSCRKRAIWSICPRTFIFASGSTRKRSPAMSGRWQRIGSFVRMGRSAVSNGGHVSPFGQHARTACVGRTALCSDAARQLCAGTPSGARSPRFAYHDGGESTAATASGRVACA